ncbi:hypothetical protein MMC26_007807, partial [Xylographa opegraphella]|nr:hypothetical protein [Xylographa opegraphella]
MVKTLTFKGDRKSKKRKHRDTEDTEHKPGSLTATGRMAGTTEDDDSWVTAEVPSDVMGPIIFAIPTIPPTFIACDANGKIFLSEIENIVEGDRATAEPHDVRQVWVASRVAGTEYISFKGHHGRYLGCDQSGILSATREAISVEESLLCIASTGTIGNFNIQTQRGKFFAIDDDTHLTEVRGDAEVVSVSTSVCIRMQGRYKPRLKANKESKAREKITRKELEDVVGRRLMDDEVKRLKRARREGHYHEAILDVRIRGKHD